MKQSLYDNFMQFDNGKAFDSSGMFFFYQVTIKLLNG